MSSGPAAATKPGPIEYLTYCYGRRLPDCMRDWVAHDLAGPGAAARMMIRVAIPAVLILAPIWLIPMSLYLHASMTLPIFLPFVYFSHALNKIWRRHMLAKHGLDPSLVDAISRKKNAHVHEAYERRYGSRTGPASSRDV
ncbi:DUF5313 domain-containing protein [Mycolicibacterium sp. 050158]|jgi:Family of unknown function (DUF5313)|uniref:DUF5313 domain-containing protein n=1 Tax=Mycolicibacterium sp. 050158 TaxID=3090602 RepID=UPI00299D0D48|nr:DUF5313 domain-containing protein [Mycolicibacterium sp. 050158]MDX1891708.1 DUF5313 domain-containing protein [Mycolicibacterium sp. 050158]